MSDATTPRPTADQLTERDVAAIVVACDRARVELDELRARGPAASDGKAQVLGEHRAMVEPVILAFVAAGLDRPRAARAATVWLLERRGPRYCVREAAVTPP